MRHLISISVALAIALASAPSVAQQPPPAAENVDWTVTGARSALTNTVLEFSTKTGKFEWRSVSENESIMQVVVLAESASRAIGPIPFSSILLKYLSASGAPAKRDFSLLSTGSWNQGCRYLDSSGVSDRRQVNVSLGSGDQISLFDRGGNDLQIAVTARRIQLCLAFAVPNSLSGKWTLKVGKLELPVAQGISSFAAAPPAGRAVETKATDPAAAPALQGIGDALSRHRFWIMGAVLLLLTGGVVFRLRRIQSLQRADDQLGGSGSTEQRLTIPVLAESDLPTGYCTLENEPGPGGAMLSAASRAMQSGDFASATVCLRQSLEIGLTPGHASKAHLFLAETAISRGDLLAAMHEYHHCLHGHQALRWAALPAATNLALIYKKLGMRDCAKLAQRFIAEAPNTGEDLHPTRVQRISELATVLKWQVRSDRLRGLGRFGRQFFPSFLRRGTQVN